MALLWRVTARWTGGNIGTGFTNMFFTEGIGTAQQAADAARAFLFSATGAANANLPTGITISFSAGVDVLEPATGILIQTVPVTAPSSVTGSGSGAYAAPTGACVSWVTSGIVNGHRVKGRTFLVPMAQSAFQSDGTLATAAISAIDSAAQTLIAAAPEFVIYHRPSSLAAGDGSTHPVLAERTNDVAAVLRSRR